MGGKYAAIERWIHRKTNSVRASRGCEQLCGDPELIDAAQSQARWMAKREEVTHTDGQGRGPADRVDYGSATENAGQSYDRGRRPRVIAGTIVDLWLSSTAHEHNLTDPTHRRSGVGVWKNGDRVFAVQMYR
jgi:uncharacterized protein YkwD